MLNPTMDQSKPSLRWMSYEATAAGLRLAPLGTDWDIKDPKLIVHESLTSIWWPLEILPVKQLTFRGQEETVRKYVAYNFHNDCEYLSIWCIGLILELRVTCDPDN